MKRLIAGAMLVLSPSLAHAQVTLDFAKITCSEFFSLRLADPDSIAVWLHGYFHGKRGDTVVDNREFKASVENLKTVCKTNEGKNQPVMQIFEKGLSAGK
jgi:acid stress chaperone HdeB